MIKSTESALVLRKRLVVPINLSLRVSGVFYAGYGLIAAGKLWQYAQAGHPSEANVYAGAILGAFALFGAGLALTVDTFSFDPNTREYTYRKGFGPFAKTITGSSSDIRSVSITRHVRVESDGETTHTHHAPALSVEIEWNDDRRPVVLFSASEGSGLFGRVNGRQRVEARAGEISEALGVSLRNEV